MSWSLTPITRQPRMSLVLLLLAVWLPLAGAQAGSSDAEMLAPNVGQNHARIIWARDNCGVTLRPGFIDDVSEFVKANQLQLPFIFGIQEGGKEIDKTVVEIGLAATCARVIRLFGPNGTTARGIIILP